MNMPRLKFCLSSGSLLLANLLYFSSFALASETRLNDPIKFSGFGSLVLGTAFSDDLNYGFNINKKSEKYTDEWTAEPDSRLGLQMDVSISETTSLTIQGLFRESVDPELSWGVFNWQATDKLNLRLGKMQLPFYYYSDYAEVGYAYPWITAPNATYFVGIEGYTGINAIYDFSTQTVDHEFEFYYGNIEEDLYGEDSTKIKSDAWGAIYKPTWDRFTLRLSYHAAPQMDFLNPDADTLVSATQDLADLSLIPQSVADNTFFTDVDAWYAGLALKIDFDQFWIMAEHNQLGFDNLFPRFVRNSISAGYFVNDELQIFGLFGSEWDDWDTTGSDAINAAAQFLPSPLKEQTEYLAGEYFEQERGWKRESLSLGFRWDFMENMAFKGQYTHLEDRRIDKNNDFIRFSIDFVF